MTILMSINVINVSFPPDQLHITTVTKDKLFRIINEQEVFFIDGINHTKTIKSMKAIFPDTDFINLGGDMNNDVVGMTKQHILIIIIDYDNFVLIKK